MVNFKEQDRITAAMWNSMTPKERKNDSRLKGINQGVLCSMWHALTGGCQALIKKRFEPAKPETNENAYIRMALRGTYLQKVAAARKLNLI